MKNYILVVNRSSELVLVGDKYLYPGERRSVPAALVEAAQKNYPGALEVMKAEAEPVVAEAEPVVAKAEAEHAEAEGATEVEAEPTESVKKTKAKAKK